MNVNCPLSYTLPSHRWAQFHSNITTSHRELGFNLRNRSKSPGSVWSLTKSRRHQPRSKSPPILVSAKVGVFFVTWWRNLVFFIRLSVLHRTSSLVIGPTISREVSQFWKKQLIVSPAVTIHPAAPGLSSSPAPVFCGRWRKDQNLRKCFSRLKLCIYCVETKMQKNMKSLGNWKLHYLLTDVVSVVQSNPDLVN